MNWQHLVRAIVGELETVSSVEGAFLSGSLANQHLDDYSDVDLGIASSNSSTALDETFAVRRRLLVITGRPIRLLERSWGHCRMVAALYGKSQFPPIGLEVDLVFSQVRHVAEQMPYAPYRIVFDRNEKLQAALAKMSRSRPVQEMGDEIGRHLTWFPFYAHEANKACRRGDRFQVQSMLEEMRKSIFFAAATRQGQQIFGSKRAYRYLTQADQKLLRESYRRSDENMVANLTRLYVERLSELRSRYRIADDVENLKTVLRELV
jgi:predicted nucleotidyltransferase